MKSRVGVDFLLILFVYAICGGLIYCAYAWNWPLNLLQVEEGADAGKFLDDFLTWSVVAGGVSLTVALAWYVLGEWGPKASQTSDSTWRFIWLALLLGVILGTTASCMLGPTAVSNGWGTGVFYVLWGPVFYYVATLFLSPVNTKFIVPGSGAVRRGW